MPEARLSIIIPVLNDAAALKNLLPGLQSHRARGHEVLLVDGGSNDGSLTVARSRVDRILMTGTGRGRQMNLGAELAQHEVLLFLHADSVLPPDAADNVLAALARTDRHWGRFDVGFDSPGVAFAIIAAMMNLRSRLSGVATGDQGIFVRKETFHAVGGFESIPLMEDVALSKALRLHSRPVCLHDRITTSARRWQTHGVVKTILFMWFLRLAYACGANPHRLAELYYPANRIGDGDA